MKPELQALLDALMALEPDDRAELVTTLLSANLPEVETGPREDEFFVGSLRVDKQIYDIVSSTFGIFSFEQLAITPQEALSAVEDASMVRRRGRNSEWYGLQLKDKWEHQQELRAIGAALGVYTTGSNTWLPPTMRTILETILALKARAETPLPPTFAPAIDELTEEPGEMVFSANMVPPVPPEPSGPLYQVRHLTWVPDPEIAKDLCSKIEALHLGMEVTILYPEEGYNSEQTILVPWEAIKRLRGEDPSDEPSVGEQV